MHPVLIILKRLAVWLSRETRNFVFFFPFLYFPFLFFFILPRWLRFEIKCYWPMDCLFFIVLGIFRALHFQLHFQLWDDIVERCQVLTRSSFPQQGNNFEVSRSTTLERQLRLAKRNQTCFKHDFHLSFYLPTFSIILNYGYFESLVFFTTIDE